MNPEQRSVYFALIVIKVLLGLLFINHLSIDLDEPFSIFHAQKDLGLLNELFVHENNPPLHFWLLHFWVQWFGIEPFAVRSLSLVFSVLTMPILLSLGQQLKNTETGLWIIALFVFSNFHHSYALEARAYAMFSFFFAATLWVVLKSSVTKNWLLSVCLGVCFALLLYTHYMAVIVIPVVSLVYFINNLRKSVLANLGHSILSLSVFFVGAFPVLKPFVQRLIHVKDAGTWVAPPQWSELYGLINKFMNGPGFLMVLGIFLAVLLIRKKLNFYSMFRKILRESVGIVLMISIFVYLGSFLLSKFSSNSVFLDRYLFFVSIGFFALLAWFLTEIQATIGKWSWIPFFAVILGFNPLKTHNRASDDLVHYAQQFQGSYIITPPFYDLTFLYHYNRETFARKMEKEQLFPIHIYPVYDLNELSLKEMRKPLVLIDGGAQFVFGERKLKQQLEEQFSLIEQRSFPGEYEVLVFE